MRVFLVSALTFAASLIITPHTYAAPLTYNEMIDGDIRYDIPGRRILTYLPLGFGTNTIQGRVGHTQLTPTTGSLDSDLFSTILPENAKLDSIKLTYSNGVLGTNRTLTDFNYILNNDTNRVNLNPSPFTIDIGLAALSLEWIGFATLNFVDAYDYTIEINLSEMPQPPVTEVPLPAAFLLFLAGLSSLGFAQRNKACRK